MFVEMLNGIKLMFCPKIHSAFSFTYNKNLKEFIILTQKNEPISWVKDLSKEYTYSSERINFLIAIM